MAEWLVERGIGEDRAILVEGDDAIAAKLRWPGDLRAGEVVSARLVSRHAGASRGTATTAEGREILLDRLPAGATEGSAVEVAVTRAAIAERGRYKRAQGRVLAAGEEPPSPHTPDVFASGRTVHRFPAGLWDDVWSCAWAGELAFDGGALLFSDTPAMTVIDIDGDLRPRDLCLAAVPPLARALRLFDVGGSIGIDFPTIESKADRKAVDAALDVALAGWPHERTAMNGFGFVQIVARLEGPSLLRRMATSRVDAAVRMALRRAGMVEGAGAILLTVHPALKAKLRTEWIGELARRTGREVRIAIDPGLALEGGYAQIVPL